MQLTMAQAAMVASLREDDWQHIADIPGRGIAVLTDGIDDMFVYDDGRTEGPVPACSEPTDD